ncbi:calcium/sodium antiporter [Gemmobacter fulvus]|uniref:Calcium/sodium antiporter n=1 Tax=Gemmobacter fulvus TaxID=2840474 RepID=A0A975P9K9_9RHOB|nr:calcium/sodium antiporter [Gemmobacter fulvus]MBT9244727.1 calcium/sodium antiporter [Gemmobacter fulvus]MDQ1848743.1 calcium/sodium antiporter [Gemmobacter fulvus]QWK91947.1 calcium/sodium antiporter [Gemmobacter fulvus]
MDLVYVAAGLVLLVFGGDALVRGAVSLALRLGIPALIVGLTVVAFGTSAPELIVSVNAALDGQAGIALGNVVGSNIVNILVILGLPALIATIHSSQIDTRRSYLVMLATTLLFIVLSFFGPLTWWHGLILLAGLALTLWDNIRQAQAHRASAEPELAGAEPFMPVWKITAFIVAGLVALGFGASLLVDGAVNIARSIGVSETVIGLTLVAIGTSLPELVTSVMAAFRKQADVAMGNVIGSNTFNILAILGITGLIAPMEVPSQILTFDNWVMLAASLLLVPFVFLRQDIGKVVGLGLMAAYGAYAVALVA